MVVYSGRLLASPPQDSTDDLEGGGQYGAVSLCLRASQFIHVLNPIIFLLLALTEGVKEEQQGFKEGLSGTHKDSH